MNDIDYILDFAVHLGAYMLASGANLERVDDTIYRVCLSYRLEEISLFSLSSIIQLGARMADGTYGYRQLSIPATGIHLERLNNLSRLSRRVCSETPNPSKLSPLLEEAEKTVDYSIWQVVLGQLLAMACVCLLSGGALTRCVYLVMQSATSQQFFQSLIAAMCAATFAEIMAMYKKMPSTVLLYPSIIPLIPGDLFYNAAVQFVLQDMDAMKGYAAQCGLALSGICIGFVVVSTFNYYRRIYRLGSGIARTIKVITWRKGGAKRRGKEGK